VACPYPIEVAEVLTHHVEGWVNIKSGAYHSKVIIALHKDASSIGNQAIRGLTTRTL
jgi:hypothetical protein